MIFDPKLLLVGDYSQITVLTVVVIFENDLVVPVRKRRLNHRGSQGRHCLITNTSGCLQTGVYSISTSRGTA